ncbi:integrase core domain-containing protein [Streptomyces griseoincarnatus]
MTHPVYTLNLTAAQRSVLEWLTQNGGLFTTLEVDIEQIAEDCSTSVGHHSPRRPHPPHQPPPGPAPRRDHPLPRQPPVLLRPEPGTGPAGHRRPGSARRPARRPRRPPPPTPNAAARYASVGDAYDNALMESTIGLYIAELIKPQRPWKTLSQVELATAEWIDWYNHRRLHGEIGHIPLVEYEANYYTELKKPQVITTI